MTDETSPADGAAVGTPTNGSGPLRPGRFAALGVRLRKREDDSDDEGPFFAPEAEAAPVPSPSPASSPRPRPTPAASPPLPAEPVDAEPPRPRPRPGPGRSPDRPAADTSSTVAARNHAGNGASTSIESTATAGEHDEDATGTGSDQGARAPEKKDEPRQRRSWRDLLRATKARRRIVKLIILVVVVVAAALSLRAFVVAPYYIPSQSMEPTLHGCPGCNDDHVLVDRLSYRFHHPHAGDVVVFDKPAKLQDADSVLIKRVVGEGGDLLVLKHGLVYVNGRRVAEPYLNKACGPRPSTPLTGRSRWQIPTGDVFVMGDNRCRSEDSRYFGPIPDSSIVGRAFVIVWPLKRISTL